MSTTETTEGSLHIKSVPHSHHKKNGIHLVLRSLFNKILQMKYDFYQNEGSSGQQVAKVAGAASEGDQSTVQLGSSDDDEKTQKLSKRFGPEFIISFCCILILLYIIFSVLAHFAYREFKGLAEDCAGGSINSFDGNILHYAVIDKREGDRIEFEKELAKKKKEFAKRNGAAAGEAEEAKGLLEEEKKAAEDEV